MVSRCSKFPIAEGVGVATAQSGAARRRAQALEA